VISKDGLIYKFFSSNKYLLAVLVVAPLLLYFTFGTTLYNGLDEIVETNISEESELRGEGSGKIILFDGELIKDGDRDILNPEDGEENIVKTQRFIIRETLLDSLLYVALVSLLIGTTIASLSWGKLAEDGSIVYPIILQSSRKKTFLELFTLPLLIIALITGISSTIIAYEAMIPLAFVGFFTLFLYTSVTIFTTILGGYIIGIFISLIGRNTFLPIVVSLFCVGSISAFPNRSELVYPIESLIRYQYFGLPVSEESIIGVACLLSALSISYMIFKGGDFY